MAAPNPQLSLANAQYMAWKASAEAIAGSGYIFDPSEGSSLSPYRPKVWGNQGQLFAMRTKPTNSDPEWRTYYFDAVLRAEHISQRRLTQHPVQTGANITDHSFQLPAKLTMEVAVSDVMDCYDDVSFPDWQGSATGDDKRTINAYQELRSLQKTGRAVDVVTRLYTFENMIIESINVVEDYRTRYEMRASIIFQQIITAGASEAYLSTKPQTNQYTDMSMKSTTLLTTKELGQYKSPSAQLWSTISGNN